MTTPIYLDHNATTPLAPEVLEAMLPFLREQFGNPSSTHRFGRFAAAAVAEARGRVADLIGARPEEIVFTGCATEANNLALLGTAGALAGIPRHHLMVSAVEHPAVLAPALQLQRQGWQVTVLPVDGDGRVDPADVARALSPQTTLVSVMHANNEVGTIQPIEEIAEVVRGRGALLHSDAAQIVGLGAAARLAREQLGALTGRLRERRDELHRRLALAVPGLALNGHAVHRLPNTLHVSFPGVRGRDLLRDVGDTVAASVGSACHSEHDAVSGVLAAMGIAASRASGAVRLSVGRSTTVEDVARAAAAMVAAWQRLSSR